MEMKITLAGAGRVEAHYKGLTIVTDQDGSAPAPFELFLASLGTCAGIYVARFCQQRGLPTDGLEVVQKIHWDAATRRLDRIEIELALPASFPDRYKDAVVRAAEQCAVKKALAAPPEIAVHAVAVAR